MIDYKYDWHLDGDDRKRSRHAVFNIKIPTNKITAFDVEYIFNTLKSNILDVSNKNQVRNVLLNFIVNDKDLFAFLINTELDYESYSKFAKYRFCIAERRRAESEYIEARMKDRALKKYYVKTIIEEINACTNYQCDDEVEVGSAD